MRACLCVRRLTLVADDADPPIGAVTASFPRITFSAIRTVVARQTAVVAEGVIQTHWNRKVNEYSRLKLALIFNFNDNNVSV